MNKWWAIIIILFLAATRWASASASVVSSDARERVCLRLEFIEEAASEFQLEAELLLSCLAAEHELLYDEDDVFADIFAPLLNIKNVSYGFVQMQVATARGIRHLVKGNGEQVEDQVIIDELLDDSTAVKYMAALLSQYREVYEIRYGIKVIDPVGTYCTLYQVGNAEAKARKHKQRGTRPKANQYGYFASNVDTDSLCQN